MPLNAMCANQNDKSDEHKPHEEHSCDLQLEIYPLNHMTSHIVTAQIPTTHDKPLYGIGLLYYLEVGVLHLTFHFVALENQDVSVKSKVRRINLVH